MNETVLKKVQEHIQNTVDTKKIRIPILPEVAGKVIYLVNDPDVGIKEVVSLLEKDSVIAAHVIKVSNSVVYNPKGVVIKNLNEAATRLGTNLLNEIALSVSLQSGIFIQKGYIKLTKQILEETISVSLFVKELYGLTNADYDLIYLASLFHNVGTPSILYHINDFKNKKSLEIEDEIVFKIINDFQNIFTLEILKKWNISSEVIKIVNNHKQVQKTDEYFRECGILRLSILLTSWLLYDNIDNDVLLESDELVFLNIHPKNLTSILSNKEWLKSRLAELIRY